VTVRSKNESWRSLVGHTLLANGATTLLGLINSIVISRSLGPGGRGELAATLLWPGLLIYLSSMGLIVAAVYFSSQASARPQVLLNNLIAFGVLLSALAIPIGFFALPWLLRSQSSAVVHASRWYLAVIPLSLLNQFGLGILQGRLRLRWVNRLRLIMPCGYLVGTIALLLSHQLTVMNIVAVQLVLNLVSLLATIVVLAIHGVHPNFKIDLDLGRRMFGYGCKVHLGQVSGLANISLDQALIAAWLPPAYLGLYVVAVSVSGVPQLFASAVEAVTTPSVGQKESRNEQRELALAAFRRYWRVSLLIVVSMAALLPLAIPVIFGSSFKSALLPAEILLLASLFMGARQVLGGVSFALGDPWLGSKGNIAGLLGTVILLYLLLPALGIVGAAIASAGAYFAEVAVILYGLRRRHAIPTAQFFRLHSKVEMAQPLLAVKD